MPEGQQPQPCDRRHLVKDLSRPSWTFRQARAMWAVTALSVTPRMWPASAAALPKAAHLSVSCSRPISGIPPGRGGQNQPSPLEGRLAIG
jgi:hypothetical protein